MDTTTPLETFVDALVGIGGQLTTTLQHMLDWREAHGPAPDAREVPVVLDDASRRIADELLLVGGP